MATSNWKAGVVLGVLVLAGCGGDADDPQPPGERAAAPNIVQPGAPGEDSRELTPEEAAEIESVGYTDADVEFMQGMLHHHAQALEMTALVESRTASQSVPLLAARTEASQEAEMELMKDWLRARDEEVPDDASHHGGGHGGELMPGMLTPEEMAELKAARGTEFDRRFLRSMTRHHQGALQMVRDLHEQEGGAEAEIAAFVRHVEADQGIEIARMQELLADL